jgi:hypothetical protein
LGNGGIGAGVRERRQQPRRLPLTMRSHKLQDHPIDEQDEHPTPNRGPAGPHRQRLLDLPKGEDESDCHPKALQHKNK